MIAFLVLAHDDWPLLSRLCNRLRDHVIFVHVDAKSRDFPIEKLTTLSNVVLVEPRVAIHWAGFAMVEATLAMLQGALDRNTRFSKYVLISGRCYPVKPIADLAAKFSEDNQHNYMSLTEVGPSSVLRKLFSRYWCMTPLLPDKLLTRQPKLRGVEKHARAVLNKLSSFRPRDFQQEIGGLQPYFGSSWWAISEAFARYVLAFVESNPAFVRAYRTTYAPDEGFFHTILAHSPFSARANGVQPDKGPMTNQAAPLHLIHPSEKRTFSDTEADFELARSTDKFFIRKVSSSASGTLLDRIDRQLL